MDKKTIIIATIKSQVALYDQLLFSPCAFCVLLLRSSIVSGSNNISVQNNQRVHTLKPKQAPWRLRAETTILRNVRSPYFVAIFLLNLWFRLSYISSLLHSLHPLTAPDLQANRPISPRQLQSKKPFLHLYKNILLIPASCYWSVVIMFWCHRRVAAKTPIPQCGSVAEFLGHQNLISSYFKMLTKSFVMKPIDHVWSHIFHGISIFTK